MKRFASTEELIGEIIGIQVQVFEAPPIWTEEVVEQTIARIGEKCGRSLIWHAESPAEVRQIVEVLRELADTPEQQPKTVDHISSAGQYGWLDTQDRRLALRSLCSAIADHVQTLHGQETYPLTGVSGRDEAAR